MCKFVFGPCVLNTYVDNVYIIMRNFERITNLSVHMHIDNHMHACILYIII